MQNPYNTSYTVSNLKLKASLTFLLAICFIYPVSCITELSYNLKTYSLHTVANIRM